MKVLCFGLYITTKATRVFNQTLKKKKNELEMPWFRDDLTVTGGSLQAGLSHNRFSIFLE